MTGEPRDIPGRRQGHLPQPGARRRYADRREDHPRYHLRFLSSSHRCQRDHGARAARQRRRRRACVVPLATQEVERLFNALGNGKIDNHQNWKGRFKDNSDKMRTGSIYDVADVLKSLTLLSRSKSLSFREKRMLDRAKFLIISEISEVMRETAESIEGTGRKGARAQLHHPHACHRPREGREGGLRRRAHGRTAPGCPRVVSLNRSPRVRSGRVLHVGLAGSAFLLYVQTRCPPPSPLSDPSPPTSPSRCMWPSPRQSGWRWR